MDDSIFKAYDIRGIYPEQINKDSVYKISRAFGIFLKDFYKISQPKIVIGYDIRKSSKELLEAAAQGLREEGCLIINIGLCSTPLNYFANQHLGADASVMITASHNPKEYNGLKFSLRKVMALAEVDGIEKIKDIAISVLPPALAKRGAIEQRNLLDDYLNFLIEQAKGIDFSRWKIAVDCGNGMVGPLFVKLAKKLNINYQGLFMEPDGDFPNHEPNPLKEENLLVLKKLVRDSKADLGIAFDGDGDRIGVLDEEGNVVRNDFLVVLFAKHYILKEKKSKFIPFDLRISRRAIGAMERAGAKVIKCKVGYPNIRKAMRKHQSFLGGELANHIFWQDFSYSESALLSVIRIFKVLQGEKKPLIQLIGPLQKNLFLSDIDFEVVQKEQKIKEIEERFSDGKITKLDGLSVEYKDWWFNVRVSNTEPLLRLTVEANSEKLLQEKLEELRKLIINNQ